MHDGSVVPAEEEEDYRCATLLTLTASGVSHAPIQGLCGVAQHTTSVLLEDVHKRKADELSLLAKPSVACLRVVMLTKISFSRRTSGDDMASSFTQVLRLCFRYVAQEK